MKEKTTFDLYKDKIFFLDVITSVMELVIEFNIISEEGNVSIPINE